AGLPAGALSGGPFGPADGASGAGLAPGDRPMSAAATERGLDARAERNLDGVHPDLVRVVRHAARISAVAFTVTEGRRSLQRQRQLRAAGASHTLNSRHLTGHAVDLAAKVGGQVRWDWPLYVSLA